MLPRLFVLVCSILIYNALAGAEEGSNAMSQAPVLLSHRTTMHFRISSMVSDPRRSSSWLHLDLRGCASTKPRHNGQQGINNGYREHARGAQPRQMERTSRDHTGSEGKLTWDFTEVDRAYENLQKSGKGFVMGGGRRKFSPMHHGHGSGSARSTPDFSELTEWECGYRSVMDGSWLTTFSSV